MVVIFTGVFMQGQRFNNGSLSVLGFDLAFRTVARRFSHDRNLLLDALLIFLFSLVPSADQRDHR